MSGGEGGTRGTQHGDRTQGVQRIDRAPRDSRGESSFNHSEDVRRPSNKPAFMKGKGGPRPSGYGQASRGQGEGYAKSKFDGRGRTSRDSASSTSWEAVGEWYGSHLSAPGTYQSEVVWPGAMRLLGVGAGKTFLDIACGEGSFAQLIVKQGGAVVGVDAAPTLVRQAQNKKIRDSEFFVADAGGSIAMYNGKTFDGAAIVLALQNMSDMNSVLANVSKVLKRNAPVVIVLNHPAFRVPRQSSWGFEEERKMMYRRVDSYLTENAIPMLMHPGDAPDVKTTSFHRPISSYITSLAANGFMVDAMEEWISHKESTSGPRAKSENRIRKEVPMFMAIRARKV